MANNELLTIAQKATIASKQKKLVKLLPMVISMFGIVISMAFLVSFMYTRFGSFSIRINKQEQINYGIILSETKDFAIPTAYLNCKASEEITNISGKTLDDSLGCVDGEDNGENYICYTFYLMNSGKKSLDYEELISITYMSLNIEQAVRVRVKSSLNDGEINQVDYARVNKVTGEAEPDTVAFYSKNIILKNEIANFKPNDVMKYTVIIWLEGDDPDCVDDIIGGEFKIDLGFSVTGLGDEN